MKLAVILSARKEKDSDLPYPLIPFSENICLLDRTLEILRINGYEKIILVVGYKAELFDKYKRDDLTLIINSDYEFNSSMGSLALCEEYISEDFVLIEGDTFFEQKLIQHISEIKEGNCLSVTEESGSGDECYIETKKGFVTKITKDKHQVFNFEGEMIGVSRITFDTYKKMLEVWKRSSNPNLNYEYLFMNVTDVLDRPFIHYKNLIWGDVDCNEDFIKLKSNLYKILKRKENPFDEENIRDYLKTIFPREDIHSAMIEQIGGMSNKNFKIDYDNKSYVLRIPGNGSEGMVERENEEFNALEACKMGVCPEIRYFNSKTGIKLTDYIENAETLNSATIQRHENMSQIAAIYRRIHNSHVRLKNEFNIFKEIEKYNNLMENVGATMYEGWEDFYPNVKELEHYLNFLGVDLKPCHNDALYENFIKDEKGIIYLIDWEYSGMNDPMADLAALFLEAGFTEENKDYILDKYFHGKIPLNSQKKILCYQILWDYLWSQWTVIKEAKGDDFGMYGIERYIRAKTNYNKLVQDYYGIEK